MTIAHDSVYTESVMTGTDDPHNIAHTPGAALQGVFVTAAQGTDSTDHITKVTYGGIPMRRIDTTVDVSTELGRAYLFFLGHDIPTGTQTVAVDTDATTTDIQFVVGGFTGSTDLELVDVAIAQDQVVNPSLTMEVGSRTSATVGVIYSGSAAVTDLTMNGNMTAIHDHDFGNFVARVDKQTTPSSSDFTFSYTAAVDDTAMVVAAFSEVVTPGIEHAAIITAATRTDTSDPYDFTHTPLETLQGVWVMAHQEVSSTDHITGITYGGQAMTRIQTNVDTAGEPARTYIYFLGTGIPTGAQTVSVDTDGTGDDIRFYCGGFLAATDTEPVDNDGVSEQAQGASVTLTTVSGRRAASIGVIYSGLGNFGSAVLDPGMTVIFGSQITQGVLAFVLDPVPDASNFTVAFTSGISDDVALSAAMFAEAQAPFAATTVHAVATVGSPTIPVFPATVAAVATVGSPTTAFGSALTATTVQAVGTVGVPVVTAEGNAVLITPVRVLAVATVGTPTIDTPVVIGATTVHAVTTVGAPFIPLSPPTIDAYVTVGEAITVTELPVLASLILGGVNVFATPTDDRTGWAALIDFPSDNAQVTAGGVTVVVTLLAPSNAASNVQVQISEESDFSTILDDLTSGLVNPDDQVQMAMSGLVIGGTYYIRARGGNADLDEWGDWSDTISVTANEAVGEAYGYLYGNVDTSVPTGHIWYAYNDGYVVTLIGAGFGNPQAEYTGTEWAESGGLDTEITPTSWTRDAETAEADTDDRQITIRGTVDPEHDVVVATFPSYLVGRVGVYIRTEEP